VLSSTPNVCNETDPVAPVGSSPPAFIPSWEQGHFVKTPHSSNATVCSVGVSGSKCPTKYPVRCDDIQPFDPYKKPRFPHKAHAKLEGYGKKKGDYGHVYFEEEYYDKTKVSYRIHSLKPHGVYGMYVHEKSSFHPHGCKSTGGVYDPFYNGRKYGHSKNKAVGDLGYIKADANGVADGHFYHQYVMVEGPIAVVHRPVVLHYKGKYDGKYDGEYGYPACGEITQ
ncbi:Superoxide dismutase [Cu-Zn], partial [Perkinsus olseni]